LRLEDDSNVLVGIEKFLEARAKIGGHQIVVPVSGFVVLAIYVRVDKTNPQTVYVRV